MKALIINGSPRKDGATSTILRMIENRLQSTYEVEHIFAYDLKIKPCMGCSKCRPASHCVLPADDGQIIGTKMADADLIVVGSPTYWGNIPAPLKVIFDRNVTTFEHFAKDAVIPQMKGKKAVIVVTSGSSFFTSKKMSQSWGAIQAIKTVLQSGGLKIIKTINIWSAWNMEKHKHRIETQVAKINFSPHSVG